MSDAVGFAGLGAMGLPMAVNLSRAGVPVLAWNRGQPARDAGARAGLRLVQRPADLALAAGVVFTMLPDLPQVMSILDGPAGLLCPDTAMRVLVVMGTVSPVRVAELATALRGRGFDLLDAPVSGGVTGAGEATLSIMVGGRAEAFERVRPYLQAMGRTVRHLGPAGTGSLAKACNQVVVSATLAGLAEAVVLAERGGLDVGALLDLLGGGLASSEVLRQKRHHLATGDFAGTGAAGYLVKDLSFALGSARAEGVRLPVTAAVAGLYGTVVELGLGAMDNSAVLAALRHLAGTAREEAS